MVHTWNPGTQEAETEEPRAQASLGLFYNQKKKDDHKDIRVSKEVGKFIIRQSEKELHTHL